MKPLWAPTEAMVQERKTRLKPQALKMVGAASAAMGGEGASFEDLGAMLRIVDQLRQRAGARERYQKIELDKLANSDKAGERARAAAELWCIQEWEVLLGMVKTALFEEQGRVPAPVPTTMTPKEREEADPEQ